jgi:glutaredoxin
MNSILPLVISVAVIALSQGAQAQNLFKWVDEQGRITYSDRPAPPDQTVKDVSATMNTMGAGEAQVSGLGYETQQIVAKFPVTLYAAKACPPCDEGRHLLRKRGVPYVEKLIESEGDLKALQERFNVQTLPVLTVGSSTRPGFSSVDWDAALDTVGYAKEAKLPKGFVTGKVEKLTAAAATTLSNGTSNGNEVVKRAPPSVQAAQPAQANDASKPTIRF